MPAPVDPYSFASGQIADASQVNARFAALYTEAGLVNAIVARFGGLVTALPSSPADGLEVLFLADAVRGQVWHLRYRAASAAAYKWEFVGGAGFHAYEVGSHPAFFTASITTFVIIANGPQATVPLVGEYDVEISGYAKVSTANYTDTRLTAIVGSSAGGSQPQGQISAITAIAGSSGVLMQHRLLSRVTALAGDVIRPGAASPQSVDWNLSTGSPGAMSQRVTPVRVG